MLSDQKSAEVELNALDGGSSKYRFNDEADMRRMGKHQAFQRNFQFLSIAAFSVVAIAGWCYVPSTSGLVLANGGTGGLIIMYLVNWAGLTFVVLSMAEMSSIAPTAGGQYHWTSEFAPPSIQKSVSYISGWLSSIAWLSGTASGMNLSGSTMQGLLIVTKPDYVPQAWQGYLFVVMVATFALIVNSTLARFLPRLEGIVFVLFTLTFMATLVVVWVLAPTLTAAEVFATIGSNNTGWGSVGLGLMVVQSPIMFLIVGSDATVHMAEETRYASVVVPKAMIAAFMVNAGLAFVITVTYCFMLVDYNAALNSPVGEFELPFIQVFVNGLRSVAGATALVAAFTSLQVLGIVNWMASNARQIFAFARDRGFPFGRWIAKVDAAGTYPVNSVFIVWAYVVLVNLIALGSYVAFEAIVSLQILSLMSTYMVSLGCITWRRIWGAPLPSSSWTLGRFGLPINIIGLCYCIYLIIFLPWPAVPLNGSKAYNLDSMNWASVMFAGIMAIAAVYYVGWARKIYKGPVAYVRRREELQMDGFRGSGVGRSGQS